MTEPSASNQHDLAINTSTSRATFYERFVAEFLDLIITLVFFGICSALIHLVWPQPFTQLTRSVFILIFTIGYYAIIAYLREGQTFGKSAVRIKVVSINGDSLTLTHFILRELVARGVPPLIGLIPNISGAIWYLTYLLALSPERLAFHDLVARTQVIKEEGI